MRKQDARKTVVIGTMIVAAALILGSAVPISANHLNTWDEVAKAPGSSDSTAIDDHTWCSGSIDELETFCEAGIGNIEYTTKVGCLYSDSGDRTSAKIKGFLDDDPVATDNPLIEWTCVIVNGMPGDQDPQINTDIREGAMTDLEGTAAEAVGGEYGQSGQTGSLLAGPWGVSVYLHDH